MAMTLRLPVKLKAEADALAARLGISLNALVAVALRDYLDGRRTTRSAEPAVETAVETMAPPKVERRELEALQDLLAAPDAPLLPKFAPPKRPSDPCPCGSVDLNGQPMTWQHCHGRAPV